MTISREINVGAADGRIVALVFQAAEKGCGLRQCAYCKAWLGLAEDLATGQVTHGVCEPLCDGARAMGLDDFSTDGDSPTSRGGGSLCVSAPPSQRAGSPYPVPDDVNRRESSDPRPLIAGAMPARQSELFFCGSMTEVPA